LVAGLAQGLIVLTGAAVRLTEAGLGCENWPSCTEDRLVPELALHPWIEFGNRLLSFLVVATVAVAVVFAHRRRPRRPDLIRWSWGLVVGVVAQIVLGGMTVLVDLHPLLVSGHYLLSVVLLWNAVVLWVRASAGGPEATPAVGPSLIGHGRLLIVAAVVVLVLGTLVTGTGPNGGDSRAERLTLDLTAIARVHAVAVWCFLAVAVILAVRLERLIVPAGSDPAGPGAPGAAPARWLIAAIVAQGTIGYVQFAVGVPPALVEAHILGSVVVWVTTVYLHLGLYRRPPLEQPVGPGAGTEPGSGTRPTGEARSPAEGVTPGAPLATMET
jgi:cytochrome c oxidase assembly protein subunit 15